METRLRGGVEVNLKDMFFHILYHWRSILIMLLVGTFALGYYQYYSIESVHARGELTAAEKQYEYDLQAYDASVATSRQAIRSYRNLLEDRRNYLEHSLLLQLNPSEVYQATRVYLIKLADSVNDKLHAGMAGDPADYLINVYGGAFDNMVSDQEMEEVFGTDNLAYVREVAKVEANADFNTVALTIYANSEEDAKKQIDYITKYVDMLKPKADAIYQHSLELVRDGVFTVTRMDLASARTNVSSDIESYQNALNRNLENVARGAPGKPGDGIKKMAFFGFLIALAFSLLLFGIQYVASGRFHESRDLTARYQLPVYGELVHSRAWNHHPGKLVDRLLENWEFRKKMRNRDTVYDTLAALIRDRMASGTLLVTGTLPTEKMKPLAEALKSRLPDGPEITVRGNLANDSETLTEASKADAVIVVEEMHVSRVKDVDRIAELLSIGDANAIGFITI